MHKLKQIVYKGIQDHHTTSILDEVMRKRNEAGESYTPETAAMIADRSAIAQRHGRRNIDHSDKARESSRAGKRYDKDLLSDEQSERIIVLIREEASEKNDAKTKRHSIKSEDENRFKKYKHHQYVLRWGLFSDDEGLDEEWFIPDPEVLPQDDPQYLCDLCRHIDFRALFTMRGLPGNQSPAKPGIKLGGLSKIMQNKHCSFCSLIRRKIDHDDMLASVSSEELEDQSFELTVLDEGPDYALRLEVELSDVETSPRPRFVLQLMPAEAPKPLHGHVVDQSTVDFALLRSWFHDCKQNHGHGGSMKEGATGVATLPLRLVDTVDMCVREVTPPFEYLCLSYVWGTQHYTQYGKQSRKTLEEPQGLLNPSVDLPITVRDAITATQKLGIRYIWIDALCILQDDDDDKARIISKMGTIYGNAAMTITSLGNGGPSRGLPGVSIPRSQCQITSRVQGLKLSVAFQDDRKDNLEIEQSVWNSRAWTFQERALSQRMLYFTDSQVYMKCPHTTIFEDTIPVLDPGYKPLIQNDQMQFSAQMYNLWTQLWSDPTQSHYPNKAFLIEGQTMVMLAADPDDPEKTHPAEAPVYEFLDAPRPRSGVSDMVDGETPWEMYKKAVDAYTKRQMKFQTDAANAFLGIADLIRQGVNTEFWHGLPEFAFDESLLWHPREPLKRRMKDGKPLFPSWTWAAWEGHCSYRGRGWYNAVRFASASVVKYMERLDTRSFIDYILRNTPQMTDQALSELSQQARDSKWLFRTLPPGKLYHWDAKENGWEVKANKERNIHYYEHEAYPGVHFHYPVSLPGQPVRKLVSDDGTIYLTAHAASARFCDMSSTEHIKSLGHDNHFQIGLNDEKRSSNFRPSWRRIIYYQGYRAGFLSLNTAVEDLDHACTYQLAAMSRDSVSEIQSPSLNWDMYWQTDPVTVSRHLLLETWDSKMPPTSRTPVEDAEPDTRNMNENGDPHWDEGRFGDIRVWDVYNVLLLRTNEDTGYSERIGVGKMSFVAFHGVKTEEMNIRLA